MEAHSNKARGIVVTMLWLVLAGIVLTLITISPANKKLSVFLIVASFSSLMFILLWFGNAVACDLMDRWIDWIKEPLKRLVVGILVMVAYTGLASYGLVLLYKTAFGLRVGDTTTFQYSTIVVTLIITMFMHGRSFLKSWKSAEIEAEKAKKESVRANYESLKNQVNPHFLFNSLNVLTDLVYEDQDKAAKFIKQLSEVYRHVLDSRNMEVATLEEELRYFAFPCSIFISLPYCLFLSPSTFFSVFCAAPAGRRSPAMHSTTAFRFCCRWPFFTYGCIMVTRLKAGQLNPGVFLYSILSGRGCSPPFSSRTFNGSTRTSFASSRYSMKV